MPTTFDDIFSKFFGDLEGKEQAKSRKGKDLWEPLKEMHVTKVFQDYPIKEIFHDVGENYYVATKHHRLELSITHIIVVDD